MSPRAYRSEGRRAAAAETRARILAAARSLLADELSTTFTIDALAERAGVARMTVYNQFGSKRALVEALSDDLAARGGIDRLPVAFRADDPLAGLELLVEVFLGFWESERPAIRRLRAFSALDPELSGSNRDLRRRQAIAALVGRLGAPDPDRLIDLLWVLTGFEAYEHLASEGHGAGEIRDLVMTAARLASRRSTQTPPSL